MKKSYVRTKSAEADLREITRYTLEQWGAAQCNTYIADIEQKAEAVATGQGFFKEMPALIFLFRHSLNNAQHNQPHFGS